jgi:hypothetical protein
MAPRIIRSIPALAAAFLIAAPLAAPLAAQEDQDTTRFQRLWGGDYDGPRRIELSVGAGYGWSTPWADRVALHVFSPQGAVHQQVLLRNVAVVPGEGVAAGVTYWRGRHAFRVSGGYNQACLTTGTRCTNGDITPGGATLAIAEVPMDIWRYGVEGLVGLRSWVDSRVFRPYLIVGATGITFDPDADALPFIPGTFETVIEPTDAPNTVIVSHGETMLLVSHTELGLEHVFGATLGIGMDLRLPVGIGGVGLRFELIDHITTSPFSVRVARLDASGRRHHGAAGDDIVFRKDGIHNIRFTAGVLLELGLPGSRTTEQDPWRIR